MNRVYLGIDPGPSLHGWALVIRLGDILKVWGSGHDRSDHIIDLLELEALTDLVMEKFVVYPRRIRALANQPVKVSEHIGVFRYLAQQYSVRVHEYRASDHKRLTDAFMKKLGVRITNGHARDACRLVLWHIYKEGGFIGAATLSEGRR